MSSFLIDDMEVPWQASSPLWSLTAEPGADGLPGLGMTITAAAGAESDPAPFAERRYAPPLDLRGVDELRLWARSTRPGDGAPGRPFYLAAEATTDPPGAGAPWRRLLPVSKPNTWTLHRLVLDDMPPAVREGLGFLRIRSLDATVAFRAGVDDVVAVRPEAIADVDAALLGRFHEAFTVMAEGEATAVPAILDVPESPGTRTPPYILITPWSVTAPGVRGAADAIVDNHTDAGAFVRPPAAPLELEFRIDVYAADRPQKARLLELLLGSVLGDTQLVVANVPLPLGSFVPSRDQAAAVVPGRTPLFVRVVTEVETGPRQPMAFAVPFVLAGPADGRETAEPAPV